MLTRVFATWEQCLLFLILVWTRTACQRLSVWGLQAELETLWSWRKWNCRLSPVFARFTSRNAVSSSPSDSSSMTFNALSPFALIDSAVLLIVLWYRVLSYRLRAVLSLSPSTLVACVSIPIHQWNWRVSDGGRIDGIDLPSLVSFFVEGENSHIRSFFFAKLKLNSPFILAVSGIDLPSLKSIHLGDGCFFSPIQVEITSVILVGW